MRQYLDRLIARMNYDDGLQTQCLSLVEKKDMVNHPPHYVTGGVECIDALQSTLTKEAYRGFLKGNAIKYIWRLDKKNNSKEDVAKAIWYLTKLQESYEKQ